jgi:hypothetical protein
MENFMSGLELFDIAKKHPHLLNGKKTGWYAAQNVLDDQVHGLHVPEPEQDRGQACQTPGIRRRRDSPVAEEDPEDVERGATRLVGGDVGLQPPHTPHVVHDISHNNHVRPISVVESHVCVVLFFIVSKERVSKKKL